MEKLIAAFARAKRGLLPVLGAFSFVAIIAAGTALASGPSANRILNYQLRLTDASGIPVADGTKSVKLTFYTASSGGTQLYSACTADGSPTGTPAAVTVTFANGTASVLIGDTGITCASGSAVAIPATLFDNTLMYLGVTVGADSEMTPRKRIVATGYALNADKLDDLDTSNAGGANAFVPVTDSSGNFTLTKNVTFDSPTFFVDSTNHRVGVGTTAPGTRFTTALTGAGAGTNDVMELMTDTYSTGERHAIRWTSNSGALTVGRFGTDYDGTSVDFVFRDMYNGGAGSTEIMRIKGTGNVGIGTSTPLAPLQIATSFTPLALGSNGPVLASNAYYSSGWKYTTSTTAAAIDLNDNVNAGDITFYSAPSGTAGNALTWALNMTVKQDGKVGIGDASPASLLTVGDGDDFQVDSSGRVFAPSGASGAGNLAYSFVGDTDTGLYRSAANEVRFQTAGSDRVTIDASGNVGIGATVPGTPLEVNGVIQSKTGTNAGSYQIGGTTVLDAASGTLLQVNSGGFTNVSISGNVGIGDTTPASLLTVGSGDLFNVNTTGDVTSNFTTLNGSSTASGAGTVSTTLVLAASGGTNFDVGNYVKVDSTSCVTGVNTCYAKITAKATDTLTISPAISWANLSTVTEVHVPEVGGVDLTQALANRYGRGYFIDGVVAGNGSTYITDNKIESGGTLVINGTGNQPITFGTGTVTIPGTLSVTSTGNSTLSGPLRLANLSGADPTGTNGLTYYNTTSGKFRCYQGGAWTDCIGAGGGGMSIGGTVTSGTTGSLLFVGSGPVLAQDNANFFWNDTTDRFGLGTASPSARLHVVTAQPSSVGTSPGTAADTGIAFAGGAGGNTSIATTGVGGIGSGISLTGGAGGTATAATISATGGAGGPFSLTTGAGASQGAFGPTGLATGGAGGDFVINLGAGGIASAAAAAATGGAGGAFTINGGAGGLSSSPTSGVGGAGSPITLTAGAGGNGAFAGGAGGSISFTAGAGGTGGPSAAGNGGNITLNPGAGGASGTPVGTYGSVRIATVANGPSVVIGDTTTDGKLKIRQDGTADIFNLYDGTTNVFTVLDGGSVGIGTSSPAGVLHIASDDVDVNGITLAGHESTNGALAFRFRKSRGTAASPIDVSNGDNAGAFNTQMYSGGTYFDTASVNFKVDGTFTSGQRPPSRMEFFTNAANGVQSERMRIDSAGNVGIGTVNLGSPSANLHVHDLIGFNTVDEVLRLDGEASGFFGGAGLGSRVAWYLEDSANNLEDAAAIDAVWEVATNGSEESSLRFLTSDNGTLSEKMRIDDNGNVGIGTSSPVTQLHVTGTIPTAQTGSLDGDECGLQDVYVQERYAYVVGNSAEQMQVMNVSDPASISSLSVNLTGAGSAAMQVQGRYAYVVNKTAETLEVIDVSNPSATADAGSVSLGASTGPTDVQVQGRYAYVANGTANTLRVVDVSNPASPALAGSVSLTGGTGPTALFIKDRYAYVVDGTANTLRVVDVSNPASPALAGSVSLGASTEPVDIHVQGGFAYVVNKTGNTLRVINVTNPASPTLSGSVAVGTTPEAVYVQGRYAYVVTSGSDTLQTIDISNPASPTSVGTVAAGTDPYRVFVQGRYAYVIDNPAGCGALRTFEVGGAYLQQAEIGGAEVGTLSVRESLSASKLSLTGGMSIGQSLHVTGNAGLFGDVAFGKNGGTLALASATAGNTFIWKLPTDSDGCASAAAEGVIIQDHGGTQRGHICISSTNLLNYYANTFNTTSTDVAETYSTRPEDDIQAGDVVELDPSGDLTVRKTTTASSRALIGVISTAPGVVLSGIDEATGQADTQHGRNVALKGRVPVKVNLEGGPIAVGDWLTSSSTPGVAMKAAGPGMVIGRALDAYSDDAQGTVRVFIEVGWWNGAEVLGQTSSSGLSVTDLTVDENFDLRGFGMLSVRFIEGVGGAWSIDEQGKLTAKEVVADQVAIRQTDAKTTLDVSKIPVGQDYVQVHNPAVNAQTRVFVTFRKNPGSAWWVDEVMDGLFVVKTALPVTEDVAFDYWLVQALDERTPPATVELPPAPESEPVPEPAPAVDPPPEPQPDPEPQSDPSPAPEPAP